MRRAALVFLCLALPSLAPAQTGGLADPILPLLNSKAVQKELKLDDDQVATLQKLPPKVVEQFKADREAIDTDFAKLEKDSAESVDRADNEFLDGVVKLLNAEQGARFRQVRLHQLGVWAFLDSQVRKELGLGDKQLEAITKAQEDFQQDLTALPDKVAREAKGDAKEYAKLLLKEQTGLQAATIDRILRGLDDDQRKKWKTLIGQDLSQRLLIQEPQGSTILAVATVGRLFGDMSPVTRAELKMGEDAVKAINIALLVMARKYLDGWDKIQSRAAEVGRRDAELQAKMFEEFRSRVRREVLKRGQWDRLEQLQRQMQGVDLLVGQEGKDLALTKQQKKQVRDLRQELGRAGRGILKELEAQDPRWLQRKLQEENRRGLKELDKILDSDQAIVWGQKVGEPFDFTTVIEVAALSPPPLWVMPPEQEVLNRANTLVTQKEYALAIDALEEGIELNEKSPWAYNSLAYLLATCRDEKVRNGKRAVELATKAVLLQPEEGEFMDTLAAANAEVGQYERAANWERKAIEKARPIRKAAYEARLKLYEEKKPYRE